MPNSRKAAIVTASLVGEWKSSGQEWELFAAASLVGTRKMWALSSAVSHGPLRQAHSVTHSFWNIHTQSWHITLLLGMSPSQPVFWRADSRCWTLMTQIQRHLSWEALPLLPPPPPWLILFWSHQCSGGYAQVTLYCLLPGGGEEGSLYPLQFSVTREITECQSCRWSVLKLYHSMPGGGGIRL